MAGLAVAWNSASGRHGTAAEEALRQQRHCPAMTVQRAGHRCCCASKGHFKAPSREAVCHCAWARRSRLADCLLPLPHLLGSPACRATRQSAHPHHMVQAGTLAGEEGEAARAPTMSALCFTRRVPTLVQCRRWGTRRPSRYRTALLTPQRRRPFPDTALVCACAASPLPLAYHCHLPGYASHAYSAPPPLLTSFQRPAIAPRNPRAGCCVSQ